ncbi:MULTISPECIES: hypothetical protein [Burkholderia]|uniref:Uncharacterized protein n=1 Tax=Burkholderia aenigmatica TaxID=2015348 RepID=A0ABY6Y7E3_9BURK|nr:MULTISPECIES: hypothetical protein [Burkholderia]VWC85093.1 hypothetical protein BLA18628_01465 [Burkholderia aenigmatica]VWD49318.1 hypothetical protein BLA17378_08598 [Burkholderia aenigmatica]
MPESWNTARSAGTTPAGSRFPERPACGASQRERAPQATYDIP